MKGLIRDGLSVASGCPGSGFSGLRRSMRVLRSRVSTAVIWTFIGSGCALAIDGDALMQAALQGDLSQVTTLLAQGADVNARNNKGTTALMAASTRDESKVVQLLKKAGATE